MTWTQEDPSKKCHQVILNSSEIKVKERKFKKRWSIMFVDDEIFSQFPFAVEYESHKNVISIKRQGGWRKKFFFFVNIHQTKVKWQQKYKKSESEVAQTNSESSSFPIPLLFPLFIFIITRHERKERGNGWRSYEKPLSMGGKLCTQK